MGMDTKYTKLQKIYRLAGNEYSFFIPTTCISYALAVENILLLRIMILHDISYSHTDLKLLIRSNLIKPQGQKEIKYVSYKICFKQAIQWHVRDTKLRFSFALRIMLHNLCSQT